MAFDRTLWSFGVFLGMYEPAQNICCYTIPSAFSDAHFQLSGAQTTTSLSVQKRGFRKSASRTISTKSLRF